MVIGNIPITILQQPIQNGMNCLVVSPGNNFKPLMSELPWFYTTLEMKKVGSIMENNS